MYDEQQVADEVSRRLGRRYRPLVGEGKVGGTSHGGVQLVADDGDRVYVRISPEPGPFPPYDLAREAELMAAVSDFVTVPEVREVSPTQQGDLPPFMVLGWVEGEVKLPRFGSKRRPRAEAERIAAELVETLAAIHAIDVEASGVRAILDPGDGTTWGERLLARWHRVSDTLTRTVPPALAYGDCWLNANRPPEVTDRLAHGDFRLGNIIWADHGRVVLDWEFAGVGDPLYDLGWLLMGAIGDDDLVMGLVEKRKMVELYEQATGSEVDRQRLAWWEILAVWQRCVMEARKIDFELHHTAPPADLRALLWEVGANHSAHELLARIARYREVWG